jgi:hypothetical protein
MKDLESFRASLQNLEPDNTGGGAHTNILASASRALRMHQIPQECVISASVIVGCE